MADTWSLDPDSEDEDGILFGLWDAITDPFGLADDDANSADNGDGDGGGGVLETVGSLIQSPFEATQPPKGEIASDSGIELIDTPLGPVSLSSGGTVIALTGVALLVGFLVFK